MYHVLYFVFEKYWYRWNLVDETTASFVSHLHHEREYSGVLSTVKGIFSYFKAYAIAVNIYAVLSTAIVVNNNTSVVNQMNLKIYIFLKGIMLLCMN